MTESRRIDPRSKGFEELRYAKQRYGTVTISDG
nr:MAG TPA: hypothetical protein [Caudoviricetes sp.]